METLIKSVCLTVSEGKTCKKTNEKNIFEKNGGDLSRRVLEILLWGVSGTNIKTLSQY